MSEQHQLRAEQAERFDLSFPAALPITQHADEIGKLLRQHQVVVVAGETGSGKTTQLPKICLAAGYGRTRQIVHTQPRRLAARSVANRLAEELGTPLGEGVGYAVRFDDRVADGTVVKLITDGLLLNEVRRDGLLRRYEVVIVDEAHERSLNIDFLLGVLRKALRRRADLRVIVTSATIDVERFSRYFDSAPVLEIGGRGFPVEVRYRDDDSLQGDQDAETLLIEAMEEVLQMPAGPARDVLVFQSGEREIFESARALRDHFGNRLEVLPLYARLRATDQARIFKPGKQRRVVLATNVAETSLTVPNIGFVIDPGYARINRYSYRSKLERLPVEAVSQASANQRAGRCGRVAPGVCIRLYTEADFNARPPFTDPEIRRINLASVVLTMRAFGLGEVQRFGFIEPPDPRAVRDAVKLLEELGALAGNRLTSVGRAMARLPVDPRLARMLVAAAEGNALSEMLIITSALAVQDPRERPYDQRAAADTKHERFTDEDSDFATLLNLWAWLDNLRGSASRSGERKAFREHFINASRVREWRALHRQLLGASKDLGWRLNQEPASGEEIARAVLSGSLSLIGTHDEKGVYLGARGSKFRIFPGSSLHGRTPKWIVAADIAETARVYARTVCEVQPAWIEALAPHLLKRQHNEPHWSARAGEAQAFERVTLYGLTLAERRRVQLARIDAALARELFLREGFLGGKLPRKVTTQVPVIAANLERIAEVQALEARGRRRDLLALEDDLLGIVSERVPDTIVDGTSLVRWWRRADEAARQQLYLTTAMVQRQDVQGLGEDAYPSRIEAQGVLLKVDYRFAPGTDDDGVNVRIPIGAVQGVAPELLEWSVPGYLPGVVEGWLRTLPKEKRRKITPVADHVAPISTFLLNTKRYRNGRFVHALIDAVRAETGLETQASDWHPERLEPLLRIHVELIDKRGRVLDAGRDLAALQSRHSAVGGEQAVDLEVPLERAIQTFPKHLPEQRTLRQGDASAVVFPALRERQGEVDVVHMATAGEATRGNRRGFARLALLCMGSATRYFRREIDRNKTLGLHFAAIGDAATLRDALLMFVTWVCYFEGRELPRQRADFEARMRDERGAFAAAFERCAAAYGEALAARFELMKRLDAATSPAFADAVADIRRTVARLLPADALDVLDSDRLEQLPRAFRAQTYRIENLQGKVQRDRQHTEHLRALEARLQALADHRMAPVAELPALELALEEVRIGLFAEPLARKGAGSVKKLRKSIEALERQVGLL